MRRIAITPVYNEEKVIIQVLAEIIKQVDMLIVVDDGSSDSSKQKIMDWKRDKEGVHLISSERNQGASTALRKGYVFVSHLLSTNTIKEDDLVIELDADGQHDPKYISILCQRYLERAHPQEGQARSHVADVVLARRDFSPYPRHKIIGNWGLTLIASLLGRTRYKDVESNYRVMQARMFPKLLQYFNGYRYSGAFEVGIILGRLGYKTDNSVLVQVPHYRSGARMKDGIMVLLTGLYTFARLVLKLHKRDLQRFTRQTLAEVME